MRRFVWIAGITVCLMLVAIAAPVLAQSGFPTRTDTYINDFDGLLSSNSAAKIHAWLTELKSEQGIEMTVVTISSIRDYKTSDYNTADSTIEAFATHLFNHWGIGDKATNKGIMLLVAKDDRKVRVELGRGYDSSYDLRAKGIIDEFIRPAFKSDNYEAGIEKGVRGIIFMLTNAWPTGAAPTFFEQVGDQVAQVDPTAWLIGIGIIVVGAGGTVWYRESHRCPMCGKIDLDIQSNVLSDPTYSSEGEKEVMKYCPNCQYSDKSVVAIPMRRYSNSRSGGSWGGGSSSGSSGSSGGGSSSGGGATGSW